MAMPDVQSFDGFTYQPAIGFEDGVTRRDPSPVMCVDGVYYVWYSRTPHTPDGYSATIWYATSPDGLQWTEQGEAVGCGAAGAFDEHAVFTPTVFVWTNEYYMIYTAVPEPFDNDNGGPNGTPTAMGLVRADSPDGPWERVSTEPILCPSEDPALPDSHRLDDACVVMRQGKIWVYYKGRQAGRSPGETKMCVAFADTPEGPYRKYENNPVVGSGHEVCVWPHGAGVMALFCAVGPEGNTMQYSDDGLHFSTVKTITPPAAPGPYRADHWQDGVAPGLDWGICHDIRSRPAWPFLLRFDVTPGGSLQS